MHCNIHTYNTYIHTYMHAYIHTCLHTCIHTYFFYFFIDLWEAHITLRVPTNPIYVSVSTALRSSPPALLDLIQDKLECPRQPCLTLISRSRDVIIVGNSSLANQKPSSVIVGDSLNGNWNARTWVLVSVLGFRCS